MQLIINPGSGPVDSSNIKDATENIEQFIKDIDLPGVTYHDIKYNKDGRYSFHLKKQKKKGKNRVCEINMPGIPLEKVRYIDSKKQNIWDFPRLYVNGSDWVWCYAVGCAFEDLKG